MNLHPGELKAIVRFVQAHLLVCKKIGDRNSADRFWGTCISPWRPMRGIWLLFLGKTAGTYAHRHTHNKTRQGITSSNSERQVFRSCGCSLVFGDLSRCDCLISPTVCTPGQTKDLDSLCGTVCVYLKVGENVWCWCLDDRLDPTDWDSLGWLVSEANLHRQPPWSSLFFEHEFWRIEVE